MMIDRRERRGRTRLAVEQPRRRRRRVLPRRRAHDAPLSRSDVLLHDRLAARARAVRELLLEERVDLPPQLLLRRARVELRGFRARALRAGSEAHGVAREPVHARREHPRAHLAVVQLVLHPQPRRVRVDQGVVEVEERDAAAVVVGRRRGRGDGSAVVDASDRGRGRGRRRVDVARRGRERGVGGGHGLLRGRGRGVRGDGLGRRHRDPPAARPLLTRRRRTPESHLARSQPRKRNLTNSHARPFAFDSHLQRRLRTERAQTRARGHDVRGDATRARVARGVGCEPRAASAGAVDGVRARGGGGRGGRADASSRRAPSDD